jgi:hypothetical protein
MLLKKSFSWMLSLVMIAVVSRPALPQEASASRNETVTINESNGVQRWRTSTGLTDFNIELRGKIELTENDQDIKNISDDGYLEINKTVFGSKRTIIIESLGGGKVKKEYYEGRTLMDWEKNGKAWLSEILPEIVRSTTIGAESRVNRIFKQGGTAAVLAEIEQMESDYIKSHYANLLMQKNIPAGELSKVISRFTSEISSDYYLSTILKDNVSKMLVTSESADAFFKATQSVESDYYRSVVLKESMKKYAASPGQVKLILQSASTIGSAYYMAVVLTTLLEQPEMKEESLTELINVSKNVDSDYYRTEVLQKAMVKPNLSKSAVKSAVDAVADVSSDYYKTNVFNVMAEKTSLEPELQMQILSVLNNTVESDYYASVTMVKILNTQKLNDEAFRVLVTTAGKLESTSYAAEIFQNLAKKELTTTQLIDALKASENIDSDHYLSTVLRALAPKVKAASSIAKDAYRAAAKHIDSETYYGSALRAIE